MAKFCKKTKMPKFGTTNALFGYFWDRFSKSIVVFEISILEFLKYESLTHTMNFGIEFAFSKGPRSAFLEGLGPGPGPLYKVCSLFFKYEKFAFEKSETVTGGVL